MARAAQSKTHGEILQGEEEAGSILFVLFIPSKTADGKPLPANEDQGIWANAAGQLLTTEFGGSTEMPPAKGKWLNDDGTIITEQVILVHSYVKNSDAQNEGKIARLAVFLHRMGKSTKQGEVGVVIDNIFYRIRKFPLAS